MEDDVLQRRVLVHRLRALGVELVYEAGDGEEALEVLERHASIELVISDLAMPRMDGLELMCAIARRPAATAFALYSAMDRELLACMELLAHERHMRFLGFLAKPADNAELAALLVRAAPTQPVPHPPPPSTTRAERAAGLAAGEFVPFLQPKVRFSDEVLVGAEALARWRHPTHGVLAPAAFLDELEADGLVGELTVAMLEGAIAAIVDRPAGAAPVPIAVNLSLSFLSVPGVADVISELVRRRHVAASLVRFEITETVAMSDVGTCLENIARLRMRGHHFAIDDFGVAYSSLQQLIRIPADEIKLDRSFVAGVVPGSRAALTLDATISMAHTLEMIAVAEGIETATEWRFLADLGCDVAQGYLVSPPLPVAAFHDWAHARAAIAAPRGAT
ncbi:MAG: EAL domain-containing response regulator [Deltaproteobacteria bacterium]|nr:EAL domain-containing response regulator [Deltaproteobacteria bacterium]